MRRTITDLKKYNVCSNLDRLLLIPVFVATLALISEILDSWLVALFILPLIISFMVVFLFFAVQMTKQVNSTIMRYLLSVSICTLTINSSVSGFNTLISYNQALTYNVDHRFLLSLAKSVAVFGVDERKLDLLGDNYSYHSLPSDIAGFWEYSIGLQSEFSLLFLIPLFSSLVTFVALGRILNTIAGMHGIRPSESYLGFIIASLSLQLPFLSTAFGIINWSNRESLTPFGSGMMLNSMFALATGFAVLSLLLQKESVAKQLPYLPALLSLLHSKPQYLIGFLMLIAFFKITLNKKSRFKSLLSLIVAFFIVFLYSLTLDSNSFTNSYQVKIGIDGFGTSIYRGWTVLAISLMFLFLSLKFRRPSANSVGTKRILKVVYQYVIFYSSLCISLDFINAKYVGKNEALLVNGDLQGGSVYGASWAGDFFEFNISQSIDPLTLMTHSFIIATITLSVREKTETIIDSGKKQKLISAIILTSYIPIAVNLTTAYQSLRNPKDPNLNVQVVDSSSFSDIAESGLPIEGIAISSDIADPSDNHKRRLAGHHLVSTSKQQFLIVNGRTYTHELDGTVEKLSFLNQLFSSNNIGPFVKKLKSYRISKIYISSRCVPKWKDYNLYLKPVNANEDWMLFSLERNYGSTQRSFISPKQVDWFMSHGVVFEQKRCY